MAIKIADKTVATSDDCLTDQVYIKSGGSLRVRNLQQGELYGYVTGGFTGVAAISSKERFPFATDADTTSVGSLSASRMFVAGQSSREYGYTSGGRFLPATPPTNTETSRIDKFPFSADSETATSVGDLGLTFARMNVAGQSSSENGYTSGGRTAPATPTVYNVIDKFPFSADANATDVGDLTQARHSVAGQSSVTHGYTSLGSTGSTTRTVDKFSFATDGDATLVSDTGNSVRLAAGQSSDVSGYISGGTPAVSHIWKFPFATDAEHVVVGDLYEERYGAAGQSSTTHGYTSAGFLNPPSSGYVKTIDKFPFSTDADATDVGDLLVNKNGVAGQQV